MLITVASLLVTAVVYPVLLQPWGSDGANVVVLLPGLVASWAFGLRGGLGAAIVLAGIAFAYDLFTPGLPAGGVERVLAVAVILVLVGRLVDVRNEAAAARGLYASLVEHSPVSTYVWSPKRGVLFISPNIEQLTGRSAAEWRKGFSATLDEHLEPRDRSAMAAALEELLLESRPMRLTIRIRHRDGGTIWADHHAEVVSRSEDDFTIQGTLIDVTARFEVVEARHDSEEARAQARAVSHFFATMSHELRTPLNSILGFTQLLQSPRTSLPDRQARYVSNIRSSGEHLLAVINDVLDLSRLTSGRFELGIEVVSARRSVDEAVAQIQPLSDAKQLMLHVQPGPDVKFFADSRRLHQILLNLLSNSVKYTETGTVTVDFDIEGEFAALRVSDSGIGIPAQSLEMVFEEFTQVRSAALSRGGTGLGLAVSRRLARAMGGDITVASRLGRGSTFTVTLPLAPNDDAVEGFAGGASQLGA